MLRAKIIKTKVLATDEKLAEYKTAMKRSYTWLAQNCLDFRLFKKTNKAEATTNNIRIDPKLSSGVAGVALGLGESVLNAGVAELVLLVGLVAGLFVGTLVGY